MCFNDIITQVYKLIDNYMTMYDEEPKYIKMPYSVYNYLKSNYTLNNFGNTINTIEKFMGMQVCVTLSITKVEDIEVF